MDPARWQQIERLYHAALARPAEARAAFLAEACGGDEAIRQEVQALLETPRTGEGVFAGPALAMAAQILSDPGASLLTGRRLGVYELKERIGAGGMGEVYRARDTRLGRDVAIKILPRAFTADPDRLARFEREARVLAALNHPNIATIHGVEESDGVRALVMELVEGETLAERLRRPEGLRLSTPGRGRPSGLPIEESLAITRQIADALDAAHERGIVHRDLKPANIKITPARVVKVLDFGLAKVTAGDGAASQAPTVTVDGTRDGMILGTAAYMSPEQARGQAVDKRTDIWAFGCVLYEMLAGRVAFARETISDTIAAILERQPDWTALPRGISPGVDRVLRRCLEKDPRNRLRDIGDARIELDSTEPLATPVRAPSPRVAISAALAVALVFGTAMVLQRVRAPSVPPAVNPMRFTFAAPADGLQLVNTPVPSPDGRHIAFTAENAAGQSSLWIRSMESPAPRRIEGTEGAQRPFWSPDGEFVGFGVPSQGRLKRVALSGGPVQNITVIGDAFPGATWNRNEVVLVAPDNRVTLFRVPASGGSTQPATALDPMRRENSHRWPYFLPDGRHFLYTARSDVKENTGIYVASLDSNDRTWLMEAQSGAVYAPPGYLLFVRDGTLLAQRFDASALRLSGEPMAVVGDVAQNPTGAEASFAVSANGSVVAYRTGLENTRQLVWFDREGNKRPMEVEGGFEQLRLAPDGQRAAVVMADRDSGNRDIWLVGLIDGGRMRLTSHPANDWQPAWSEDGAEIAFGSDRNGMSTVYRKRSDGSGTEELIPTAGVTGNIFPDDWSSRGSLLAAHVSTPTTLLDVWVISLTATGTASPVAQSRFQETSASLSPDGRWIAYTSDESGIPEVYVRSLGHSGTHRVSQAGGMLPRWRRDGRELFFVNAANRFMAVAVGAGDTFVSSRPVALFTTCLIPGGPDQRAYDVAPDGSRSLWLCPTPPKEPSLVNVFVDWAAGLEGVPR